MDHMSFQFIISVNDIMITHDDLIIKLIQILVLIDGLVMIQHRFEVGSIGR